jgi:hypothetical protein
VVLLVLHHLVDLVDLLVLVGLYLLSLQPFLLDLEILLVLVDPLGLHLLEVLVDLSDLVGLYLLFLRLLLVVL